jgi:hypothetical protein
MAMSFANELVGFIVGHTSSLDSGFCIRTTNGGVSWSVVFSDAYPINFVSFPTPAIGYITMGFYDGGFIGKTVDSGVTWKFHAAPPASGFLNVFFRDSIHGFFRERDPAQSMDIQESLNSTDDGLQSWRKFRTCTGCNIYESFCFVANRTWCAASGSQMYRTSDDGQSWNEAIAPGLAFVENVFFHKSVGYSLFGTYSVIKSTDSGLSWQYLTWNHFPTIHDSVQPYIGCAPSDKDVYLLARDRSFDSSQWWLILKSTNGGGTIESDASVKEKGTAENFYLFPNPAQDYLFLPSSSDVLLRDAVGRSYRFSKQDGPLDVSHLPSGVYYISDGQRRARFVKE